MACRSVRSEDTGSGGLPTHGSRPGRAWMGAWVAIAGAAVANGAVRERYLVPRFGEVRAQQISTGALVAVIWTVAAGLGRARPLPDRASALTVASGWVGSTMTFEVGLGLLRRVPLRELVAAYDLRAGRLWALVPITMAVAPIVVGTHALHRRVSNPTIATQMPMMLPTKPRPSRIRTTSSQSSA